MSDLKEFFAAVDTVCMECAYQDEECDTCPVWKTCEKIRSMYTVEEIFEPDDADLEMGFDPYLGCYTDDC